VYGTQSLRRTKVLLIVQTTGNLKAAQLLLGHTRIESTARYLETELNAALKISEKQYPARERNRGEKISNARRAGF